MGRLEGPALRRRSGCRGPPPLSARSRNRCPPPSHQHCAHLRGWLRTPCPGLQAAEALAYAHERRGPSRHQALQSHARSARNRLAQPTSGSRNEPTRSQCPVCHDLDDSCMRFDHARGVRGGGVEGIHQPHPDSGECEKRHRKSSLFVRGPWYVLGPGDRSETALRGLDAVEQVRAVLAQSIDIDAVQAWAGPACELVDLLVGQTLF